MQNQSDQLKRSANEVEYYGQLYQRAPWDQVITEQFPASEAIKKPLQTFKLSVLSGMHFF